VLKSCAVQNKGIVVIAATNMPDALDPALIRPGRFDKQVAVHAPDIKGRTEILDLYLKKTTAAPDVNTAVIAKVGVCALHSRCVRTLMHAHAQGTPGFTGADLANLVNLAAIKASRRSMKGVDMKVLEEAKDDVLMGAFVVVVVVVCLSV
jgi:ATP-dependent Zn protease